MKYRWLLLLVLGLGIFLLSGCNEVEEILGKVNQILDQQLEETESADATSEDTSEATEEEDENSNEESITKSPGETTDADTNEDGMSDGHENEADPMLSFEERLQQAGYSYIDPPNGFPLTLPLDWTLVQVIKEEPWEGVFCFDTQLDETIVKVEDSLREYKFEVVSDPIMIDSDNVHSTKFQFNNMNEAWRGDMIYFIDEYGTTCTKVYLEFGE